MKKEVAILPDTPSPQWKKIRITLVNETQIGESESASEMYLCFKVIISAPSINSNSRLCKQARGNTVDVCTFIAQKTAAWENGIIRGE